MQGSRSVAPASSVTYTATATGPGGSASDSARITVRIPAAAAPTRPEPRSEARASMDEMFRQNVQTIYFDLDKSDIRPDQVPRVEADASWLKEHRGLKFRIEGHCDERGSEEYNLALGDRRANRVKELRARLPRFANLAPSPGALYFVAASPLPSAPASPRGRGIRTPASARAGFAARSWTSP